MVLFRPSIKTAGDLQLPSHVHASALHLLTARSAPPLSVLLRAMDGAFRAYRVRPCLSVLA